MRRNLTPLLRLNSLRAQCLALVILLPAGAARADTLRLSDVPSGSLGFYAEHYVESGNALTLAEAILKQQGGGIKGTHLFFKPIYPDKQSSSKQTRY